MNPESNNNVEERGQDNLTGQELDTTIHAPTNSNSNSNYSSEHTGQVVSTSYDTNSNTVILSKTSNVSTRKKVIVQTEHKSDYSTPVKSGCYVEEEQSLSVTNTEKLEPFKTPLNNVNNTNNNNNIDDPLLQTSESTVNTNTTINSSKKVKHNLKRSSNNSQSSSSSSRNVVIPRYTDFYGNHRPMDTLPYGTCIPYNNEAKNPQRVHGGLIFSNFMGSMVKNLFIKPKPISDYTNEQKKNDDSNSVKLTSSDIIKKNDNEENSNLDDDINQFESFNISVHELILMCHQMIRFTWSPPSDNIIPLKLMRKLYNISSDWRDAYGTDMRGPVFMMWSNTLAPVILREATLPILPYPSCIVSLPFVCVAQELNLNVNLERKNINGSTTLHYTGLIPMPNTHHDLDLLLIKLKLPTFSSTKSSKKSVVKQEKNTQHETEDDSMDRWHIPNSFLSNLLNLVDTELKDDLLLDAIDVTSGIHSVVIISLPEFCNITRRVFIADNFLCCGEPVEAVSVLPRHHSNVPMSSWAYPYGYRDLLTSDAYKTSEEALSGQQLIVKLSKKSLARILKKALLAAINEMFNQITNYQPRIEGVSTRRKSREFEKKKNLKQEDIELDNNNNKDLTRMGSSSSSSWSASSNQANPQNSYIAVAPFDIVLNFEYDNPESFNSNILFSSYEQDENNNPDDDSTETKNTTTQEKMNTPPFILLTSNVLAGADVLNRTTGLWFPTAAFHQWASDSRTMQTYVNHYKEYQSSLVKSKWNHKCAAPIASNRWPIVATVTVHSEDNNDSNIGYSSIMGGSRINKMVMPGSASNTDNSSILSRQQHIVTNNMDEITHTDPRQIFLIVTKAHQAIDHCNPTTPQSSSTINNNQHSERSYTNNINNLNEQQTFITTNVYSDDPLDFMLMNNPSEVNDDLRSLPTSRQRLSNSPSNTIESEHSPIGEFQNTTDPVEKSKKQLRLPFKQSSNKMKLLNRIALERVIKSIFDLVYRFLIDYMSDGEDEEDTDYNDHDEGPSVDDIEEKLRNMTSTSSTSRLDDSEKMNDYGDVIADHLAFPYNEVNVILTSDNLFDIDNFNASSAPLIHSVSSASRCSAPLSDNGVEPLVASLTAHLAALGKDPLGLRVPKMLSNTLFLSLTSIPQQLWEFINLLHHQPTKNWNMYISDWLDNPCPDIAIWMRGICETLTSVWFGQAILPGPGATFRDEWLFTGFRSFLADMFMIRLVGRFSFDYFFEHRRAYFLTSVALGEDYIPLSWQTGRITNDPNLPFSATSRFNPFSNFIGEGFGLAGEGLAGALPGEAGIPCGTSWTVSASETSRRIKIFLVMHCLDSMYSSSGCNGSQWLRGGIIKSAIREAIRVFNEPISCDYTIDNNNNIVQDSTASSSSKNASDELWLAESLKLVSGSLSMNTAWFHSFLIRSMKDSYLHSKHWRMCSGNVSANDIQRDIELFQDPTNIFQDNNFATFHPYLMTEVSHGSDAQPKQLMQDLFPYQSLERSLATVRMFFSCYIFGVGSSSMSTSLEFQQSHRSKEVDLNGTRTDQKPLAPPPLITSAGESQWSFACLAAGSILTVLDSEAGAAFKIEPALNTSDRSKFTRIQKDNNRKNLPNDNSSAINELNDKNGNNMVKHGYKQTETPYEYHTKSSLLDLGHSLYMAGPEPTCPNASNGAILQDHNRIGSLRDQLRHNGAYAEGHGGGTEVALCSAVLSAQRGTNSIIDSISSRPIKSSDISKIASASFGSDLSAYDVESLWLLEAFSDPLTGGVVGRSLGSHERRSEKLSRILEGAGLTLSHDQWHPANELLYRQYHTCVGVGFGGATRSHGAAISPSSAESALSGGVGSLWSGSWDRASMMYRVEGLKRAEAGLGINSELSQLNISNITSSKTGNRQTLFERMGQNVQENTNQANDKQVQSNCNFQFWNGEENDAVALFLQGLGPATSNTSAVFGARPEWYVAWNADITLRNLLPDRFCLFPEIFSTSGEDDANLLMMPKTPTNEDMYELKLPSESLPVSIHLPCPLADLPISAQQGVCWPGETRYLVMDSSHVRFVEFTPFQQAGIDSNLDHEAFLSNWVSVWNTRKVIENSDTASVLSTLRQGVHPSNFAALDHIVQPFVSEWNHLATAQATSDRPTILTGSFNRAEVEWSRPARSALHVISFPSILLMNGSQGLLKSIRGTKYVLPGLFSPKSFHEDATLDKPQLENSVNPTDTDGAALANNWGSDKETLALVLYTQGVTPLKSESGFTLGYYPQTDALILTHMDAYLGRKTQHQPQAKRGAPSRHDTMRGHTLSPNQLKQMPIRYYTDMNFVWRLHRVQRYATPNMWMNLIKYNQDESSQVEAVEALSRSIPIPTKLDAGGLPRPLMHKTEISGGAAFFFDNQNVIWKLPLSNDDPTLSSMVILANKAFFPYPEDGQSEIAMFGLVRLFNNAADCPGWFGCQTYVPTQTASQAVIDGKNACDNLIRRADGQYLTAFAHGSFKNLGSHEKVVWLGKTPLAQAILSLFMNFAYPAVGKQHDELWKIEQEKLSNGCRFWGSVYEGATRLWTTTEVRHTDPSRRGKVSDIDMSVNPVLLVDLPEIESHIIWIPQVIEQATKQWSTSNPSSNNPSQTSQKNDKSVETEKSSSPLNEELVARWTMIVHPLRAELLRVKALSQCLADLKIRRLSVSEITVIAEQYSSFRVIFYKGLGLLRDVTGRSPIWAIAMLLEPIVSLNDIVIKSDLSRSIVDQCLKEAVALFEALSFCSLGGHPLSPSDEPEGELEIDKTLLESKDSIQQIATGNELDNLCKSEGALDNCLSVAEVVWIVIFGLLQDLKAMSCHSINLVENHFQILLTRQPVLRFLNEKHLDNTISATNIISMSSSPRNKRKKQANKAMLLQSSDNNNNKPDNNNSNDLERHNHTTVGVITHNNETFNTVLPYDYHLNFIKSNWSLYKNTNNIDLKHNTLLPSSSYYSFSQQVPEFTKFLLKRSKNLISPSSCSTSTVAHLKRFFTMMAVGEIILLEPFNSLHPIDILGFSDPTRKDRPKNETTPSYSSTNTATSNFSGTQFVSAFKCQKSTNQPSKMLQRSLEYIWQLLANSFIKTIDDDHKEYGEKRRKEEKLPDALYSTETSFNSAIKHAFVKNHDWRRYLRRSGLGLLSMFKVVALTELLIPSCLPLHNAVWQIAYEVLFYVAMQASDVFLSFLLLEPHYNTNSSKDIDNVTACHAGGIIAGAFIDCEGNSDGDFAIPRWARGRVDLANVKENTPNIESAKIQLPLRGLEPVVELSILLHSYLINRAFNDSLIGSTRYTTVRKCIKYLFGMGKSAADPPRIPIKQTTWLSNSKPKHLIDGPVEYRGTSCPYCGLESPFLRRSLETTKSENSRYCEFGPCRYRRKSVIYHAYYGGINVQSPDNQLSHKYRTQGARGVELNDPLKFLDIMAICQERIAHSSIVIGPVKTWNGSVTGMGGMPNLSQPAVTLDNEFTNKIEIVRASSIPYTIQHLKKSSHVNTSYEQAMKYLKRSKSTVGRWREPPIMWHELAAFITKICRRYPKASPFDEPVNAADAPDYYTLVQEPMWLRRIEERLHQTHASLAYIRNSFPQIYEQCILHNTEIPYYGTEWSNNVKFDEGYNGADGWYYDMMRVFRNCRQYNLAGSTIANQCLQLQQYLKALTNVSRALLCYLHLLDNGTKENLASWSRQRRGDGQQHV